MLICTPILEGKKRVPAFSRLFKKIFYAKATWTLGAPMHIYLFNCGLVVQRFFWQFGGYTCQIHISLLITPSRQFCSRQSRYNKTRFFLPNLIKELARYGLSSKAIHSYRQRLKLFLPWSNITLRSGHLNNYSNFYHVIFKQNSYIIQDIYLRQIQNFICQEVTMTYFESFRIRGRGGRLVHSRLTFVSHALWC